MKSFAIAVILILTQASPASSDSPYEKFIGKADLIVIAWREHTELEAVENRTTWVVTYRVKEVLKGRYDRETITLRFDSSSFDGKHNLVILFVRNKPDPVYVGPMPGSSTVASKENLDSLRIELRQWEETRTIIPFSITGVVLVAAFLVVLLVLVVVIRKRPKGTADTDAPR